MAKQGIVGCCESFLALPCLAFDCPESGYQGSRFVELGHDERGFCAAGL
jgi:hypothetical protein